MRNFMNRYGARDRVADGAAFLDKTLPGWDKRVNVRTLSIVSPKNCVLGQLYGSYSLGCNDLGIMYGGSCRLGFDASEPLLRWAREYRALTVEWRRVIRARQAVRAGKIGREITRREYEKPDAVPAPAPALPVPVPEHAPEPEKVPAAA